MDSKKIISGLILGIVLVSLVSAAVSAQGRRGGTSAAAEAECASLPSSDLSLGTFTGGIAFIFAGGMGPIFILVLAFVVGMIVSYVLWAGF